jgi:predicted metal-dependent phosphoesterase TrpH
MFADLHLHTHFSDGTYSPEKVVASGREHGLSILALTDHDTLEGCARAAAACAAAGMEFITGAELTAEQGGHEVHLLAYFVVPDHPRLRREMAKFQAVRQDRIREMVVRLNRINIPLEAEAVFALANCNAPGRPHVARALVAAGQCRTLDEAFERFLKKHRPAWVPKYRMSAAHAIELVHEAGGLAVMAHPGLNRTDEVIPPMAAAGLDGLECFHSRHSTFQMEQYLALAEQLDLLVTGGSDCHGESKGRPLIGSIKLPSDYVTRMKQRLAARAHPAPAVHAAAA